MSQMFAKDLNLFFSVFPLRKLLTIQMCSYKTQSDNPVICSVSDKKKTFQNVEITGISMLD